VLNKYKKYAKYLVIFQKLQFSCAHRTAVRQLAKTIPFLSVIAIFTGKLDTEHRVNATPSVQ